jgi:aspartate racemase
MLEGMRFLESAGVEAIAIACNTAHHWAGELQAAVRVPLLHLADAAMEEIARLHEVQGRSPIETRPGARRVALLGTRGTLDSGFYQQRFAQRGLEVIEPTEAVQQVLDRTIAMVKRNALAEACASLSPVVQALRDDGAQAAILACTELPLAAPREGAAIPLVDPTQALARALVRFALRSSCGP